MKIILTRFIYLFRFWKWLALFKQTSENLSVGFFLEWKPFKDLGIYTDEILHSYTGKNRLEVI